MKKTLTIILCLISHLSFSAEKGSTILDENEALSATLIAEYIEWAEPFIREYPPRFKSEEHQKQLLFFSMLVMGEIKSLDLEKINDPETLTDLGYILSMGHNLDLGTAEQAKQYFEKALSIEPNNIQANYLLGMFLVSTREYHFDSIPFLEKALQLGQEDALYVLGLLKVQKGKTEEGLQMLDVYSKKNPDNDRVKMMIKSIKDNQLKFRESDENQVKVKIEE